WLTFTPLNWSTPQTISVAGIDDAVPDGNATYQINLGPCSSGDQTFSGKSPLPVSAVNLDDDLITVSQTSALVSQPQGGSTVTLTFHAKVTGSQQLLIQYRSTDPTTGWTNPAVLSVSANSA